MAAITDIISLWPSVEAFAADAGVSVGLARVWKTRKSIPSEHWWRIEDGARCRGITGATASDLARLVTPVAA